MSEYFELVDCNEVKRTCGRENSSQDVAVCSLCPLERMIDRIRILVAGHVGPEQVEQW